MRRLRSLSETRDHSFRADLGPTSTGDKMPDLGKTICHTGEVPSVTYDKTSDVDGIRNMDQSIE